MTERIIVSLTTWSARVDNVPAVLDTIFAQTLPPDLVVLNVAYDLEIPQTVQDYLDQHHVEIYRCPDTKVYKKLIHTLKRYPNDCVISIDDDWLYPEGMIEDFVDVHKKYPDYPISGNKVVFCGMQCHCGCASLTKAEYFGEYLCKIDGDVIDNCPSDDLVYTYFAYKNGHPYIRTENEYHINMIPIDSEYSYSEQIDGYGLKQTIDFMESKYGQNRVRISSYIKDKDFSLVVEGIENDYIRGILENKEYMTVREIKLSKEYRVGWWLLRPFRKIKRVLSIQN